MIRQNKSKSVNRRTFLELSGVTALAVLAFQKIGDAQTTNSTAPQVANLTLEQKVSALLAQMSLEEKIQMTHGTGNPGYVGYVPPIPRLGIPALTFTDGSAGVRSSPSTAMPAPVALAASWDRGLAQQYGATMGAEASAKGLEILLAPMINIVRVPEGGRNFETFGEDPYLTSQIAVAEIKGIQSQGVIAVVKHYAANNQEKDRNTVSADVDERTLREIYLPGFEAAVKQAQVGSLMTAYNKVNNVYSSENTHLIADILKLEWGFDGFVMSDWAGTHSTVGAANAGLDMEMPTGQFFGTNLLSAVGAGQVSEATIDDKVRRILRVMLRFGLFDRPATSGSIDYDAHARVARQVAEAGIVLLKNEGNLLPLNADKIKTIAIIGPDADNTAMSGNGGSAFIQPLYTVSPLAGITNRAGNNITVRFVKVPDPSNSNPATNTAASIEVAVAVAQSSDVAIVFVRDFEAEGGDRDSIELPLGQDQLIQAVARANKRTVVVLNTGSSVFMNRWVNNVPAIVEAWYPGQEDGNAIASVLFGDVNPSGKLPITFARQRQDLSVTTPEQYPGINGVAHYSEGIFVGYRYFNSQGRKPLFAFGHGLSYTKFEYTNLRLSRDQIQADEILSVSVQVRNIGKRQGAEVVQLYIQDVQASVSRPVKELKGFEKVLLLPGQAQEVEFQLDYRSLAFYDPASGQWVVEPGEFNVLVGSSSRDIRLSRSFTIVRKVGPSVGSSRWDHNFNVVF